MYKQTDVNINYFLLTDKHFSFIFISLNTEYRYENLEVLRLSLVIPKSG